MEGVRGESTDESLAMFFRNAPSQPRTVTEEERESAKKSALPLLSHNNQRVFWTAGLGACAHSSTSSWSLFFLLTAGREGGQLLPLLPSAIHLLTEVAPFQGMLTSRSDKKGRGRREKLQGEQKR